MGRISLENIESIIDHTLLRADAVEKDISKLCEEAEKYKFASVCINPVYVSFCASILKKSQVRICTVAGFPLGANTITSKAEETARAVADGADEVDMVVNIGAIKSGNYEFIFDEINCVRKAAVGKVLKVILENTYLTDYEKRNACLVAKKAGGDYVKTSTGFASGGAVVEDVILMRKVVGKKMGVKAAGGIRSLDDALKMISAGADRLGTSMSVSIIEERNKMNII